MPVIVLSQNGMGDRLQGLKIEAGNLASMFQALPVYADSLKFLFTKYKNDMESKNLLKARISDAHERMEARDKGD